MENPQISRLHPATLRNQNKKQWQTNKAPQLQIVLASQITHSPLIHNTNQSIQSGIVD
jgi:hypothetical protein